LARPPPEESIAAKKQGKKEPPISLKSGLHIANCELRIVFSVQSPESKVNFREFGGSFLPCFFAAIDSSGGGQAKSGLKFFVTQKLTAWQLFLISIFFDEKAYFYEK
jgi:hypothetical protein